MTWHGVVAVLGLALAAGTALGVLAPWWWHAELTTHWAPQAACAIVLCAAAVARPRHRAAGGMMALMLLALLPQLPAAWRPRAPTEGAGRAFRVAHGNLFFGSHGPQRQEALARILAGDPAIVTLVEALPGEDRPRCDLQRWPHQIWQPQPIRPNRDQVALLSRYPILTWRAEDLDTQPFLVATLDVQGRHLHVLVVHAPAPVGGDLAWARERQLRHLALTVQQLVTEDPAPVLALGDFNCTPRSPWWNPVAAAGLLTARAAPATWHQALGPAGIAIDHLLGRDLAIAPPQAITLPGSDHRGLATTVAFLR